MKYGVYPERGDNIDQPGWETRETGTKARWGWLADTTGLFLANNKRRLSRPTVLSTCRTVIRVIRADKFSYYALQSIQIAILRRRVYSYIRVYASVHMSHTRGGGGMVERSETTVNHFCESRVYRAVSEETR